MIPLSSVPATAPVFPKRPNSTVFVPTSFVAGILPKVSLSPINTGIVGTAAYIPTAFSTRVSLPEPIFWLGSWDNEAVVPIFIVPPTLTSCISWSIPTPTLLSPLILIVPELYTPLIYLESVTPDKPERPISPPGRIVTPPRLLWALKLLWVLLLNEESPEVISVNSLIPGLNTVIIPKLPLEFTSILFWLSAFINTLPLFAVPLPPPCILTTSFPLTVVIWVQWGCQLWGSSGFNCIPALSGAFKEIVPEFIIWVIVLLNEESRLEKPKAIWFLFVGVGSPALFL